jgi:hypothetical protein
MTGPGKVAFRWVFRSNFVSIHKLISIAAIVTPFDPALQSYLWR